LVQNALDAHRASGVATDVRLEVFSGDGAVEFRVTDQGAGIDEAVVARLGEPFFSTKPPGSGLGLGVYLTRELALRLGGSLRHVSTPGRGTEAVLSLPCVGNEVRG
jgi:two-component system sensor histidine kinase RegB